MVQADPPDFIDSGSYNVSDVSGWGMKGLAVMIGIVVFLPFIVVGLALGGRLTDTVSSVTGIDTGDGGAEISIN